MGQCIVISERPVTPKGINPEAKPDKKKILSYVFKDDCELTHSKLWGFLFHSIPNGCVRNQLISEHAQ